MTGWRAERTASMIAARVSGDGEYGTSLYLELAQSMRRPSSDVESSAYMGEVATDPLGRAEQ